MRWHVQVGFRCLRGIARSRGRGSSEERLTHARRRSGYVWSALIVCALVLIAIPSFEELGLRLLAISFVGAFVWAWIIANGIESLLAVTVGLGVVIAGWLLVLKMTRWLSGFMPGSLGFFVSMARSFLVGQG